MKTIVYFSLVVLTCTTACNREDIECPQTEFQDDIAHPLHMRSIDEALSVAQPILDGVNEDTGTRSLSSRSIGNIEMVTNDAHTRSNTDTVLYLVNFKDGGFALLGRSKNSHPVYAFSDEGSLSMNDTIHNKGVGLFLHDAILDATIAANEGAETIFSTIPTDSGIDQSFIDYSYWLVRQVKPMLPKHVSRWHQDSPYNAFAPELPRDFDHGKEVDRHIANGVVGCIPLSAGQLMAYYQWPKRLPPVEPTYIYSAPLNWEKMTTGLDDTAVAYFLEHLAGPAYYKCDYESDKNDKNLIMGDGRTSSSSKNTNVFKKIGYDTTDCYMGYDFSQYSRREEVLDFMSGEDTTELTPAAPVLVFSKWVGYEDKSGHQWVMDGYVEYNKVSIKQPYTSLGLDLFLHCIWGECDSSVHGYYLYFPDEKALSRYSKELVDYKYRACNLSIYGKYTLGQ